MSSTQRKQQEAAARRRAERRLRPNTVSWVDEGYSRRLARLMRESIEGRGIYAFFHLESARRHPGYVAEETTPAGSTVYALTTEEDIPDAIGLIDLHFDPAGRLRRRKSLLSKDVSVGISDHALRRLFERLRTNSQAELIPAFKALTALPVPTVDDLDRQISIEVPGGTFHMVCAIHFMKSVGKYCYPMWVCKTFIPDKPAARQRVEMSSPR